MKLTYTKNVNCCEYYTPYVILRHHSFETKEKNLGFLENNILEIRHYVKNTRNVAVF